jgi:endonuclease/exonuclease/phosphatase family metal-dependent hydrolase
VSHRIARPVRAALASAVLVVAVLLAAPALAGDTEEMTYRQTFLQFNLCGNACSNGGFAVVDRLVTAIRDRAPAAVTLNEVCQNQYSHLLSQLDAYRGRFDPTGPTCHNGARYGNAILIRSAGVDLVGSWLLPNPAGDESRRLMCLRPRPPAPRLTVCVTHISNVSGNIAAQVGAVAAHLRGRPAVLLGGDFNTDPADPRMDPLYSNCYRSGTGDFREADSAGCASRAALNQPAGSDVLNEDTYRRHKFDYIFLSEVDWSAPRADATDGATALSDHDPFWATAILRP